MPATDADNAKRQQAQTGPNNDITDVPGIQVGNAIDEKARTGVSVVIPNAPAICACDVRGGRARHPRDRSPLPLDPR